jgi:hypothetical protein
MEFKKTFNGDNFTEVPAKSRITDKDLKSDNGLQNLVLYYQQLFDIEENFNYYNITDYQDAKRNFVKYCMNNRVL